MKEVKPRYYTKMYKVAKIMGISYPTLIRNYIESDWLIAEKRKFRYAYKVDIEKFKAEFGIDLKEIF